MGETAYTSGVYTENNYLVQSPTYSTSSAHHQQTQNFGSQSPTANPMISAMQYSPFLPPLSRHSHGLSPTYSSRALRQGDTMPPSQSYPVPVSSSHSPSSPTYTPARFHSTFTSNPYLPSSPTYINVTSPTNDNPHVHSQSLYYFSALNDAYTNSGPTANPVRAGQIAVQNHPPNALAAARPSRISHGQNPRRSGGDNMTLVMRYLLY
jgi:hypothetical protein